MHGWTHGRLKSSAILLSRDGHAKNSKEVLAGLQLVLNLCAANIECCRQSEHVNKDLVDTKALGRIIATAMDKGPEERDSLGVRHANRWTEDALDFVSKTEFSSSAGLDTVSPLPEVIRKEN